MKIFLQPLKKYYTDENYEFLYLPPKAIYKISFGNIKTYFDNRCIQKYNSNTLNGRINRWSDRFLSKIKPVPTLKNRIIKFLKKDNLLKDIGIPIILYSGLYLSLVAMDKLFRKYINIPDEDNVIEIVKKLITYHNKTLKRQLFLLYLLLYISVFGPIYEERFFRGTFTNKIKTIQSNNNIISQIIRILIVNIAFGSAHMSPIFERNMNLYEFIFTSYIGASFSVINEVTKSLRIPTIIHIMNNSLITLRMISYFK
jgi:membrane protease YdiL (CAAX protease family)